MRTGIIGAGKVGCSLGKYFRLNNLEVTGYYDVNENLAKEAADFTATAFIKDLDTIVKESDTLFLTVPDDLITTNWATSIKGEANNNDLLLFPILFNVFFIIKRFRRTNYIFPVCP